MSAPVVTQRKRRSRGDLGPSAHELRYAEPTLNGDGCYLDGSLARDEGDVRDALNRSKRAAKASAASHPASAPRVSLELPPRPNFNELGDGEAARRREAIAYFYRMIGAPDEETWDGPPRLGGGVLYDPRACDLLAGAAPLIVEDSMEATIVCNAVQQGVSLGQATVLVNVARGKAVPERAPLSYSAVQGYCARSDVVDVAKRGTKKSGSLDVNSPGVLGHPRFAARSRFRARSALVPWPVFLQKNVEVVAIH
ncbi:hypothetical protein JL722_10841 [Aureococcus anophagefferens]|nr:hypothetical protein JL722_10841 [Aureococcus anophagefferens]